jgi:hypothetical protein
MLIDEPTSLYRIWDRKHKVLLYVGIAVHWPRRMDQHSGDKDWFPIDGVVEFEQYPNRPAALAAEEKAIRKEKPLYNIQHNGDNIRMRLRIEAEVEFHPGNIAAMLALVSGGLLAGKWAADALANWWVQRQGTKQGVEVQVPKVVNPFAQDPLSPLAKFCYLMLAMAATAEQNPDLLKTIPPQALTAMSQALVTPAQAGEDDAPDQLA